MKSCPNCGSGNYSLEELWGFNFYPYTNSFGYCYKCYDCNFRSEPKGTKVAAKNAWEKGKGHIWKSQNSPQRTNIFRWFRNVIRRSKHDNGNHKTRI